MFQEKFQFKKRKTHFSLCYLISKWGPIEKSLDRFFNFGIWKFDRFSGQGQNSLPEFRLSKLKVLRDVVQDLSSVEAWKLGEQNVWFLVYATLFTW